MADTREGLTGILDALQAAIENARNVPLSSSVMVSKAELLDLVAQAREVMPEQLTRADDLLAHAEGVLDKARTESEMLVAQGHAEAARLASAEEVVTRAKAEAEQIVAAAHTEADARRRDADDYADKSLANLEVELGRIDAQVKAGRSTLASRLHRTT